MKKPNSTKTLFIVELVRPAHVSMSEMKEFIRGAIVAEVGHRMPDEPIHYLDRKTVKVKSAHSVLIGIDSQVIRMKKLQKKLKKKGIDPRLPINVQQLHKKGKVNAS